MINVFPKEKIKKIRIITTKQQHVGVFSPLIPFASCMFVFEDRWWLDICERTRLSMLRVQMLPGYALK